MNRRSAFVTAMMVAGFLFLYLPILLMIAFSFNESRLVTVWGGFSTKWYGELFRNQQILGAAWLSFKIAAMNATGATVLGTLAGLALARFGRFRGRPLLTGLATAPLVMPEVITGLSLLLLFVAMEQLIGWPEGRGITTITIAHMTFSMAYVTVVVQSRLATLDESLEEAAMDLGARPAKVFFLITLPIVLPAILAGWLLAFTLSWDHLVITTFVTGPGSSTPVSMLRRTSSIATCAVQNVVWSASERAALSTSSAQVSVPKSRSSHDRQSSRAACPVCPAQITNTSVPPKPITHGLTTSGAARSATARNRRRPAMSGT